MQLGTRAYHSVNDLLELNHDVTFDRKGNLLGEIASSYRLADTRDVLYLRLSELEVLHSAEIAFLRRRREWTMCRDNRGTVSG